MNRALYTVYLAVALNACLSPLAGTLDRVVHSTMLGAAPVVIAHLTVLASALVLLKGWGSDRRTAATALIVLGCQAFSVMGLEGHAEVMPTMWWAFHLNIAVVILVGGTVDRARAVPFLILYVILTVCIRRGDPATVQGPLAFAEAVQLCQLSVLAVLVVPLWRRIAAVADATAEGRLRRHEEVEGLEAVHRQQSAVRRLLHDEVIHALRTVRLPPAARRKDDVIAICSMASGRLRKDWSPDDGGESDLMSALRNATAPILSVRARVSGPDHCFLPTPVVAGLVGVVAEALRNVERHAGVLEAEVTVDSGDQNCRIQVRDRGCGFDPARENHGEGLRSSVNERGAELGADVHVGSAPGRGTTVTVDWRRDAAGHQVPTLSPNQLARIRKGMLVAATAPAAAGACAAAAFMAGHTARPEVSWAAVLLAVVGTTLSVRAGRQGAPGWQTTVLMTSLAVVVVALGGWALRPTGHPSFDYFAAGASGPLLCVVAFFRPPRETVIAVVPVAAVIAAACYRAGPGWSSLLLGLPAVASPVISVTVVVGLRMLIDRIAPRLQAELDGRALTATRRADVAAWQEAAGEHLDSIRREVLPVLDGMVSGQLDPDDPAVQREAGLIEALVRDRIQLGAASDASLESVLNQARQGGAEVEVFCAPEHRDMPVPLLDQLLRTCLGGQLPSRLVLSVTGRTTRSTGVSVLVSPPPQMSTDQTRRLEVDYGAEVRRLPTLLLVRAALPVVRGHDDRPREADGLTPPVLLPATDGAPNPRTEAMTGVGV